MRKCPISIQNGPVLRARVLQLALFLLCAAARRLFPPVACLWPSCTTGLLIRLCRRRSKDTVDASSLAGALTLRRAILILAHSHARGHSPLLKPSFRLANSGFELLKLALLRTHGFFPVKGIAAQHVVQYGYGKGPTYLCATD